MKSLSIIIPVYNSESTIEPLCDLLIHELEDRWRLQIVLVDDGSQDRSAAACRLAQRKHPGIVDVVVLARNFGEHNAVMAGLNVAEGDYAVIMDDDFQNPPETVRMLLEEMEKGYDVVYAQYASKKHHWFRNLGSRLHNNMATRALKKPADLYLSSYKAISRFVVREVVRYTGPDPYLDAIILRTTQNIGAVTVPHQSRSEGKSGYTLRKLVSLWGNMIVTFSLYPLRLLGVFGLLMTLAGACFACFTLFHWIIPGAEDPDSLDRLNASMWFFRGTILLAVSIVGEYVGRIYMFLNGSPQYIVRRHLKRWRREDVSNPDVTPLPGDTTERARERVAAG